VTDADRLEEGADRVLLLTAHNAKGLEFPVVIVAGMEEGLFPHGVSMASEKGLEEERRLFYVALTRAADEVMLTAAAYRRRFDGVRGGQVSRFVGEIPSDLLEREVTDGFAAQERRRMDREERGDDGSEGRGWGGRWSGGERTSHARRAASAVSSAASGGRHRAVGRTVYHESFGRGVVVDAEGDGPDARFTVRFAGSVKKVLGRFLSGGEDGDQS
jgi:DNA helicase-2/ATP-dependent DNA helicase PcrA